MRSAVAVNDRHLAAVFHARRTMHMAIFKSTARSRIHDVTILHASFVLDMTMGSRAAFPAERNIVDFITLVDTKKAMHATMSRSRAFRFTERATALYASAFVHIAVTRQAALRRIRDDAAAGFAIAVENGAVVGGAASRGIHGFATFHTKPVVLEAKRCCAALSVGHGGAIINARRAVHVTMRDRCAFCCGHVAAALHAAATHGGADGALEPGACRR